MVEMILPDGTYVSSIVANLNTFSSNPGTSKGEGEIIYNTTVNKVYVNIGTTGSPNWDDLSTVGTTDHGALTGLGDDDHTQYLLVNGTRNATGDLTIYKTNPNLILYPTDTNSPRIQFKNNSNALKGSVYQNADNMVVLCEDGALNIATAVTTGGNVTLETKGVARLTIEDAVLTATVPLAMGTQKITGLDIPTAEADATTKGYVDALSNLVYLCTSTTRPSEAMEAMESYTAPSLTILGITWDGSNMWSCDTFTNKIYKHNANMTVNTTYDSPANDPSGLTWDGSNIWSCDFGTNKIYKHNANMTVNTIYDSPSGSPFGLAWDGSNMWSCDTSTDKIYKHNANMTVNTIYDSPSGYPYGLAWDGSNIWSCDNGTDKYYKHNADMTVSVSYPSEGLTPSGLTWDGSNIWSCDSNSNKIYRHGIGSHVDTEGMIIFETDTEMAYINDGSGWEGISGWTGTAETDLDMADYNITNADTIQAKSTNSLTFKVSTGKSFIFQKV